jgi:hypothetical protein
MLVGAVAFLGCVFFQGQHSFTCTRIPLQHGCMQAVWRKTSIPHANSQRKTMQTQKATCSAGSLVAFLKQKPSHKEKK